LLATPNLESFVSLNLTIFILADFINNVEYEYLLGLSFMVREHILYQTYIIFQLTFASHALLSQVPTIGRQSTDPVYQHHPNLVQQPWFYQQHHPNHVQQH
jgi:hypothetical protein